MEITIEQFQSELEKIKSEFYAKLQWEAQLGVRSEMKPVIDLAIKMGFVGAVDLMVGKNKTEAKILEFRHE